MARDDERCQTGGNSGAPGNCAFGRFVGIHETFILAVCGKQSNEYALGCGAANRGCSRLSAGDRGCEDSRTTRKSRLKGGCGQDCPAPQNRQNFGRTALAGIAFGDV